MSIPFNDWFLIAAESDSGYSFIALWRSAVEFELKPATTGFYCTQQSQAKPTVSVLEKDERFLGSLFNC